MSQIELAELASPRAIQLLAKLGVVAETYGVQSYLIGGAVRDLLLGLGATDVDVMVEGDAAGLSQHLLNCWPQLLPEFPAPEKRVLFKRYGTAKLLFSSDVLPGLQRIDFSSARSESYPIKAQPPVVVPGDLRADLWRRDFSINALAMALNPGRLGVLQDLFSGVADLHARRLRILHDLSFVDDPARLIRAVRFAVRLSFSLEDHSRELFEQAVLAQALTQLAPLRLFDEFRKALNEPEPWRVLSALSAERLLPQVLGLEVDLELANSEWIAVKELRSPASELRTWEEVLLALLSRCPLNWVESKLQQWALSKKDRRRLLVVLEQRKGTCI